jgi:hypothetical protein
MQAVERRLHIWDEMGNASDPVPQMADYHHAIFPQVYLHAEAFLSNGNEVLTCLVPFIDVHFVDQ